MKTDLRIDFINETIVMTCQFAKKCSDPRSKEYKQLQKIHRDYPDFEIVQRTIKRNPNKESYKGLTYEYMERYIISHCAEKLAEYKEMRLISECHSVRYPKVKEWFLEEFPEVVKYGVRIENTLSISEVEALPNAA